MAEVTVRYWAAAKAAAGIAEESLEAATVGAAMATAAFRHGDALTAVLEHCSFLIDGLRASVETPLPEGAVVEVLPPFAGG